MIIMVDRYPSKKSDFHYPSKKSDFHFPSFSGEQIEWDVIQYFENTNWRQSVKNGIMTVEKSSTNKLYNGSKSLECSLGSNNSDQGTVVTDNSYSTDITFRFFRYTDFPNQDDQNDWDTEIIFSDNTTEFNANTGSSIRFFHDGSANSKSFTKVGKCSIYGRDPSNGKVTNAYNVDIPQQEWIEFIIDVNTTNNNVTVTIKNENGIELIKQTLTYPNLQFSGYINFCSYIGYWANGSIYYDKIEKQI